MNWYKNYVRWIWLTLVIGIAGWDSIRSGLSWITITPVALAVVFFITGFIFHLREGGKRDERIRAISSKSFTVGFIVTFLIAIPLVAIGFANAFYISLMAGAISVFIANLYYRFA